jgi:esterase/lipase
MFIRQVNTVIPPEHTRLMYNASRNPEKELLIMPHAEHDSTYATDPQLYEASVVRFLQKSLAH